MSEKWGTGLWVEGVWATPCTKTNYDFQTQAEVDALGQTGCTSVTGYLSIYPVNSNLITNLDGLAKLTSVGGDLTIRQNRFLTNLDGLVNITSVGGTLTIGHNPALGNNLDGLANITSLGGLEIYSTVLTNLDDFAHITSIGGTLFIKENEALTNLDGLANLTSVGGALTINAHAVLTNCQGIAQVLGWPNGPPDDSVMGNIAIFANSSSTGCNSVEEILAAKTVVISAFVERFYTNILGRPSDEGGMNNWLNVINTQSASTVALGFLNSVEFKNKGLDDAAFVDILYRTLFDREGDAGGTSYWLEQLAAGKLRDMVIWGFLRAAEFKTLSDSFGVTALNAADESAYGIRAFVERFYTLVLGRQPDQGGFDNWVTALTNGTYAGGDIAKAFFLSAEYLNQNTSNDAFVETAYKAFFGREADSAGKEGWLNVLAQGQSREYVLDGFIGSAEFVALANSYGISASRLASESARMARDAEVEVRASEQAKPIPTLPMLGLFILSGLLGLFGIRRLATR